MSQQAADALMGIFGYTRVKCAYCVFSIGTDKADMYCEYHGELVKPDSQCGIFCEMASQELAAS